MLFRDSDLTLTCDLFARPDLFGAISVDNAAELRTIVKTAAGYATCPALVPAGCSVVMWCLPHKGRVFENSGLLRIVADTADLCGGGSESLHCGPPTLRGRREGNLVPWGITGYPITGAHKVEVACKTGRLSL